MNPDEIDPEEFIQFGPAIKEDDDPPCQITLTLKKSVSVDESLVGEQNTGSVLIQDLDGSILVSTKKAVVKFQKAQSTGRK